MFYLAILLSFFILFFCVNQARGLLSPFAGLDSELEQLQEVILGSEQPRELQSRIGKLGNQQPMSLYLARQLRHIFATDPYHYSGKISWLVDVEDFFHADSLLKNFMETRRVQTMPALLTGLGIFFTFLGLTVSTFGLDPTDASGLTSGVKQLVGGMSLAFSTSLTGIGCSLWWTWTQKRTEQHIEKNCFKLKQALASRSFIHSENHWYLWAQEEQRRLLSEAPNQWEKVLAKELTKLKASYPGTLSATDLRNQIEGIAQLLKEQNTQLDLVMKQFNERAMMPTPAMNSIAPTQDAMSQIQEIIGGLKPLQNNQQEAVEGISRAIQALTESSENAFNSQKTIFAAQEEMNKNLKMIREFWQTYREQLHNLQDALNGGIAEFQAHMKETMQSTHQELDQILSESLSHFSTTLGSFDQSLTSLSTVIETLNQWQEQPKKKGIFG